MSAIQEIIDGLISQKLEVIVFDKKENLIVIDWKEISDEHDQIMAEADELEGEELDEFMNYNETEMMDLEQYYLDQETQDNIAANKWLPFGVLGLCHNPESFAEMNNGGLLLFDLTQGDPANPPVILHAHSVSKLVADKFSDLAINDFVERD